MVNGVPRGCECGFALLRCSTSWHCFGTYSFWSFTMKIHALPSFCRSNVPGWCALARWGAVRLPPCVLASRTLVQSCCLQLSRCRSWHSARPVSWSSGVLLLVAFAVGCFPSSTFRKFSRCNSSCCLILLVHAVVASGPVRRSPERALCLCSSTGVLAVSSPSEVDQPWPFPFALSLVAPSPVRSSPERALCPCSLIDAAWFVNSLASPIVAFSPVLFPSGCALCPCSLIVAARSLTLRTVSWHPAQCSSLSGVLCALAR
jgi:hypothetical protein